MLILQITREQLLKDLQDHAIDLNNVNISENDNPNKNKLKLYMYPPASARDLRKLNTEFNITNEPSFGVRRGSIIINAGSYYYYYLLFLIFF